jgi:uncharacterized protein (DUF2336 family)
VEVVDQRKAAPKSLGAIRSGIGTPLKSLETSEPVANVVETAFSDALRARKLLSENGTHSLKIHLEQLECNQYVRREAHAIMHLTLSEVRTPKVVDQWTVRVDKVSGSLIAMDTAIFAAVEDLRVVANDVLQEAIDKALDDPKFRNVK